MKFMHSYETILCDNHFSFSHNDFIFINCVCSDESGNMNVAVLRNLVMTNSSK